MRLGWCELLRTGAFALGRSKWANEGTAGENRVGVIMGGVFAHLKQGLLLFLVAFLVTNEAGFPAGYMLLAHLSRG